MQEHFDGFSRFGGDGRKAEAHVYMHLFSVLRTKINFHL